jgi:hypothetical protein
MQAIFCRLGIVTNVGRPEAPAGKLVLEIGAIVGSGTVVEHDGFRFDFDKVVVTGNWGIGAPLSQEVCAVHGLDGGIAFSS